MNKITLILILAVSFAVGLTAPYQVDFACFWRAGQEVLKGVNPYVGAGFYNPIHVALAAAPLSLIPFDLAWHIHAGAMFAVYLIALSRLFKREVLWLALLAPFGLLIAYYGNLDSLILLGITLPAPLGVWLLIAKPQIGLFAAALMLYNYRSWKLTAAVLGVLIVSLAMGMIHGGLETVASMSLWPYGLIAGLPLLYWAWRKRDSVLALGAAAFISPYVTVLNWSAALPLFRVNRRMMILGIALAWSVLILWRIRL